MTVQGISRGEFFARLGLLDEIDPLTEMAYRFHAQQVVRRSDQGHAAADPWHLSFHGCFTGDTEVVTRQGIRPIRELVGDAELLVPFEPKNTGFSRAGRAQQKRSFRAGGFETAPVNSFGRHRVYEVQLRRGRQLKAVKATGSHRWMLKDTTVVTTDDLESGMKLKSIKARRVGTIQKVPFAVAQGFVFGDGTARRSRRDTAWLDLHHNGKDEVLLPYFHGHRKRLIEREGRMTCTQIQNLPRTWKNLPDFEESSAFLLSWLAGYFAAGGTVSKSGQATLTSASRDAIDCVRGILSICGVGYGQVNVNTQSGVYPHGARYEDKTMFGLSIGVRDLPSWFFIADKHKERALEHISKPKGHKHDWEVVLIREAGVEEVFCPTTSSGFFALSNELLTGNSQFPGAGRACGRQALYRMMDIPRNTGSYMFSNRKLEQIADAGKDIEDRLVMKWHRLGALVSPPPVDPLGRPQDQLVFEDADNWLTSTVDAIVLWPRDTRMIVCEVKSKYADVIADMRRLIRGPDYKHVLQIKTQIGLAKEHFERNPLTVKRCFNTGKLSIPTVINVDGEPTKVEIIDACAHHGTDQCLEEQLLEPPRYGYIYYVSRDNPIDTFSFYVDYDARHMEEGRKSLKEWRRSFQTNKLPQTNFTDKRHAHPFGWLWGDMPCKWCDFGDHCRSDTKLAIARGEQIALDESNSVDYAKGVRGDYDLNLVRMAVGHRWGVMDSATMIPPPTGQTATGEKKPRQEE